MLLGNTVGIKTKTLNIKYLRSSNSTTNIDLLLAEHYHLHLK